MNEHIDIVIAAAGSQVALAKALGVTQPVIAHWKRKGWMPVARAAQCESLYGVSKLSLVKADIREALQ